MSGSCEVSGLAAALTTQTTFSEECFVCRYLDAHRSPPRAVLADPVDVACTLRARAALRAVTACTRRTPDTCSS